jgi:hypothetical protein
MKRFISLVVVSSSMLACARLSSVESAYQSSLAPQGKARGSIIAVADFSDERAPMQLTRAQQKKLEKRGPFTAETLSSSLYGKDANTIFGVTHNDDKFTPVSRAMRDYTYQELLSSRQATIPVDSQTLSEAIDEAKDAGADYLLYGEVDAFSFVTDRPEVKPGRTALLATVIVLGAMAAASASDGSEVTTSDDYVEATPVTVRYEADITMKLIALDDNQVIWSNTFREVQERVDPASLSAPLFQEVLSPILTQATNEATRAITVEDTRAKPIQSLTPID